MSDNDAYKPLDYLRWLLDPETNLKDSFTSASTRSTPVSSGYEADNCIHCHAAYGHKILCPLLNRNIAEAQSAVLNKPDADFLKALKITW